LALIGILGAFLIPIWISSMRGVTHVVTCQEATDVPFSVVLNANGVPLVSSAATFTREDTSALCGGLHLDMRVGRTDDRTLAMTLPIRNDTRQAWEGTVKLDLGSVDIPVRIGRIPAGETRQRTLKFNVDPGSTEINGSLLLGP
jgi:hypothetical protein